MRYSKTITLNEVKSVYTPYSQFSITLPRKKLDLKSFTLYYSGNAPVIKHILGHNIVNILEFPTVNSAGTSRVSTVSNTLAITGHGLGATGTWVSVEYKTNGTPPIPPLVDEEVYILRTTGFNSVEIFESTTATTWDDTTPLVLGTTATEEHTFEILTDEYKSITRQFPRLSSCVLSDIIISVDNKQIQHIHEYIYTMAFDCY
jgi:hypothetical protein